MICRISAGTAALALTVAACTVLPPPTRTPEAAAPITEGVTTARPKIPVAVSIPEPSFSLPDGGPDTLGLAVTGCFTGCPVVSVMIDPDGYWQRMSPDGDTSGQAEPATYAALDDIFAAQGLYAFEGRLDLVPENAALCPDHQPGGQVFFMSLARKGSSRRINFDSGCAGSAAADAAASAINALIGVEAYMDIVSGPPEAP